MPVEIRSRFLRLLLIVVAVAAFLLSLGWVGTTYVAGQIAGKSTVHDLKLAIELDPNEALYHLQLGRLYEYAPATADPQKAMEQFRRAAQLSPYDPGVWLNLAAASEFQGDVARAAKYLQKADHLAPRQPEFQWPIGNFYLLHGDTKEAFRHFRVVLAGTREYDQSIYHVAWKASGDPKVILQDLIPDDLPAEFSYLYYLMTQQLYKETQPLWNRIIAGGQTFTIDQAGPYINFLLREKQPSGAYAAWTEMQNKGIAPYPSPRGNLLTNGNFEGPMVNTGFAWRVFKRDNVYVGLDTSHYHSPAHSLLVEFAGKENLTYTNVLQYIKVKPATAYRLKAFMMTSDITTDSGPRLLVWDPYNPKALHELTPSMTGTSPGWVPQRLDFKTGPKTELICLTLVRLPSQKLDNQITGKVWLDDVQIFPIEK